MCGEVRAIVRHSTHASPSITCPLDASARGSTGTSNYYCQRVPLVHSLITTFDKMAFN